MQPFEATTTMGASVQMAAGSHQLFQSPKAPWGPHSFSSWAVFWGRFLAIFPLSKWFRTSENIRTMKCPFIRRPANGPKLEGSRCSKTESRTKVTNSWNLGILKKYHFIGLWKYMIHMITSMTIRISSSQTAPCHACVGDCPGDCPGCCRRNDRVTWSDWFRFRREFPSQIDWEIDCLYSSPLFGQNLAKDGENHGELNIIN